MLVGDGLRDHVAMASLQSAVRAATLALGLVGLDVYEAQIASASSLDPVLELPIGAAARPMEAVIFAAVAIFSTLIAIGLYRAARYLRDAPAPSTEPLPQTLGPFPVNPSWIRSGAPVFKGAEVSCSPDGKTITGLWSCDGPGTFEWQYGGDETICVIEGQVHVEYLNRRFTLNAGDSVVFHAGTRALWDVPHYVRKLYSVHRLDLPVRVWRRFLRLIG